MKRSRFAIIGVLAGVVTAGAAFAGDDMTSLSYISYLERYATLQPGHGGESMDVVVNMPVLAGDRLDSSRGARVEVQLADGSTVWLDEFSTMDFDAIALSRDDSSSRTALYLADGEAAVEIPQTAGGSGPMRFDTPNGTVYLSRPGLYRIELDGNQIRVQAYSGFAELPVGVGSVMLRAGEQAVVGQQGELQRAALSTSSDDFWNWVQERRQMPAGPTAQYVDSRAAEHAGVLSAYGNWVYVPTYSSWMWQPRVNAGWVPYSNGRWYWTPVGWSWISYEPWGWYPFHYGSWYLDASFGWVWGWDSVWGPAWVDWIYTPGYVGWCPRGYYDYWYYHNCPNCWGGRGGARPGRWGDISFDFSGRVRMGDIDPRPWTFVPSGDFASRHIDRVRIEPSRFLRGDRGVEGYVRSGPLITQTPGRTLGDRTIESFFRPGVGSRAVPDLSSVFRREPTTGVRSATPLPEIRPRTTAEVAIGTRETITRFRPVQPGSGAGGERWTGRDAGGVRGGSGMPGGRTFNPGELGAPGARNDRFNNPPAIRREVIRRDRFNPGDSRPPSSLGSPPRMERFTAPRTIERVSPPPAPRPPNNNSASWRRPANVDRWQGRATVQSERWATRGSAPGTRVPRSYAPPERIVARPAAAPRFVEPAPRFAEPVRRFSEPVQRFAQPRLERPMREFAPREPVRVFEARPQGRVVESRPPARSAGRPHR